MPSTRYRTRNSFSYGSMWMSLAPFWMADISTTLTSLMTGASPPCFLERLGADLLHVLENLDVVGAGDRHLLDRLRRHFERAGAA